MRPRQSPPTLCFELCRGIVAGPTIVRRSMHRGRPVTKMSVHVLRTSRGPPVITAVKLRDGSILVCPELRRVSDCNGLDSRQRIGDWCGGMLPKRVSM